MRIGITCYPTHGGSGVVATELGKYLAERGHEVAFISYSQPLRLTELPPRVSFHEVAIVEYPLLRNFPYDLALAAKMVDVAQTRRLQILHVHYAIPFASAAQVAKQAAPELGLKVVTTLHGTDVTLVGQPLLPAHHASIIQNSDGDGRVPLPEGGPTASSGSRRTLTSSTTSWTQTGICPVTCIPRCVRATR